MAEDKKRSGVIVADVQIRIPAVDVLEQVPDEVLLEEVELRKLHLAGIAHTRDPDEPSFRRGSDEEFRDLAQQLRDAHLAGDVLGFEVLLNTMQDLAGIPRLRIVGAHKASLFEPTVSLLPASPHRPGHA